MPNYLPALTQSIVYLNNLEGDRFSYKYAELPILLASEIGFTIYCEDYLNATNALPVGIGPAGDLITWNGSSWVPYSNTYNVQIFSTAGTFTWTRPNKITEYEAWLMGSGGSGGGGRKGAAGTVRGGGSGGGGAPVHKFNGFAVSSVFPSATESVTVGDSVAGGAAQTGNDTNGNPGTQGNISQWGIYRVTGGNAGAGGSTTAAPAVALLGGTPINFFNSVAGVNGGIGSGSTTITTVGAVASTACAPGTGGSGGGISAANNGQWGGNGGKVGNNAVGSPAGLVLPTNVANTPNTYSANGIAGNVGTSPVFPFFSGGAGSGGCSADPTNTTTNGGNGGNGSNWGAGGGGGGGATNGTGNSGAGGNSGIGIVIIYSRY